MDINELLKRQESLMAEVTRELQSRGFDASRLARPAEAVEQRAAALRSRIEAIEQEKIEHAAWADQQIAALKDELERKDTEVKAARAMTEPALGAVRPHGAGTRTVKRGKRK